MTVRSAGHWKLPQPTDIKEENSWIAIPRISRIIPFGYAQSTDDVDLLEPVTEELNKLEMARKYVNQYSYREVANWLTTKTGRTISHVGLRKRLQNEKQRKNTARTLRKWAEYAEKAIEKAKRFEEKRTGAKT